MSSSVELLRLPTSKAVGLAPIFRGLAEKSNGRVTIGTLQRDIGQGSMRVWCVWDGVETLAWVLTSRYEAPTGIGVFRIDGIVGRQRKRWLHLMAELLDAARLEGCSLIECHARPGWKSEIPHLKHSNNFLEACI